MRSNGSSKRSQTPPALLLDQSERAIGFADDGIVKSYWRADARPSNMRPRKRPIRRP
jgi:hypothetical protein